MRVCAIILIIGLIITIQGCSKKDKEYYENGELLFTEKRYQEAKEEYTKLIELYPESELAKKAKKRLTQIKDFEGEYDSLVAYAATEVERNNYAQAIEVYRQALSIYPKDSLELRRKIAYVRVEESKHKLKNGIFINLRRIEKNENKPEFIVETNLPDGMECIATFYSGKGNVDRGDYVAQDVDVVKNSVAALGPFTDGNRPIPAGVYTFEFSTPSPSVLSADVKRIIGEKGENLKGPYVVMDTIDIDYDKGEVVYARRIVYKKKFTFKESKEIIRQKIHDYMVKRWDYYESIDGVYNLEKHDKLVSREAARKFGVTPEQAMDVYQLLEFRRMGKEENYIREHRKFFLKGQKPF